MTNLQMSQDEVRAYFGRMGYTLLNRAFNHYIHQLSVTRLGDADNAQARREILSYMTMIEEIVAERQAS